MALVAVPAICALSLIASAVLLHTARQRAEVDRLSLMPQNASRVLDGGSARADDVAVLIDVVGEAEGMTGSVPRSIHSPPRQSAACC